MNNAPMFFEWCVVRCLSKNIHHNNMCSKEIRLHAQIHLTILGSNMMGGKTYVASITRKIISDLIMNKMFQMSLNNYEENGYDHIVIACLTSYKKKWTKHKGEGGTTKTKKKKNHLTQPQYNRCPHKSMEPHVIPRHNIPWHDMWE